MLDLVFAFVDVVLDDCKGRVVHHYVILHSGVTSFSAGASRVTVRGSIWFEIGDVCTNILGISRNATRSFRGRPGPQRAINSPSALTTCTPAVPAFFYDYPRSASRLRDLSSGSLARYSFQSLGFYSLMLLLWLLF